MLKLYNSVLCFSYYKHNFMGCSSSELGRSTNTVPFGMCNLVKTPPLDFT